MRKSWLPPARYSYPPTGGGTPPRQGGMGEPATSRTRPLACPVSPFQGGPQICVFGCAPLIGGFGQELAPLEGGNPSGRQTSEAALPPWEGGSW